MIKARIAMGNTIRRLRQAQGLTTEQLEQLTGIPAGRLWAVENGYAAVLSAELLKTAVALEVSPVHFFEPENMPGDPEEDGAWACLRRG